MHGWSRRTVHCRAHECNLPGFFLYLTEVWSPKHQSRGFHWVPDMIWFVHLYPAVLQDRFRQNMAALNKRVRDYNLNCPVFAQMLFFDPVEEARSEFVLCVYSILTDLLAANARFLQFVFCSFLVFQGQDLGLATRDPTHTFPKVLWTGSTGQASSRSPARSEASSEGVSLSE